MSAWGTAGAKDAQGPKTNGRTVEIQILQYSDWHGAITNSPFLATHFKQDEANNPNTLIMTGGDDFGGTEPVSSLNDDVPAILVQNAFGTDVAGLGNHNFDGGIANLQEKIDLADYPYVSANLANVDDNVTGVAPYVIFEFERDIKVAVIGYTNEEAPSLVFPGNFGTIEVTDAAEALMAARADAAAEGADIFIALGHKGVRTVEPLSGELIDLANELEGFHAVLGDHTDVDFVGEINGAIVSEALSHGDNYHRITLEVKPGSGKIVSSMVETVTVETDEGAPGFVPPDPEMEALIQPFFDQLDAAFDVVIGQSTGFWERNGVYERTGEAELGNLFADAMLASTPGADIAFTNSGGIRSSLMPSNYTVSDPTVDRDLIPPDDIVVGDLFSLHNFGNLVSTQTVTGAQLHQAVEFGLSQIPNGRFPQIAGFQIVYNTANDVGSRVTSMTLDDGTPITDDTSQTFVMATTNFISAGGDGYTMLADPTANTLGLLTSAIGDHIAAEGVITPFFDCRLVDLNPDGLVANRDPNPLPAGTRADCPAA